MMAYNTLAMTRHLLGEYKQALKDNQLGLVLAERHHAWRILGFQHVSRSMIELSLGYVAAAIQHANLALEIGQHYQFPDTISFGYCILGDVFAMLRAPAQAIRYYQLGFESNSDGFWKVDSQLRLGHALAQFSQVEIGLSHIQRAISQAELAHMGLTATAGQIRLATVKLIQRDREIAIPILTKMHAETQRRGLRTWNLGVRMMQGIFDLQAENLLAALQTFEKISDEAASISQPWIEIHALEKIIEIQTILDRPAKSHRQRLADLLRQIQISMPQEAVEETTVALREAFHCYQQRISPRP